MRVPWCFNRMLLLAVSGCQDPPPLDFRTSDTAQETAEVEDQRVLVDFLWVIDNSTSMCHEQVALTRGFDAFVRRLKGNLDVDPRVAVTSVDSQCDINGTTIFSAKGKFNQKAAKAFPYPCQETRRIACLSDADCADLDCSLFASCGDEQAQWTCRGTSAACVQNPNGSINTTCRRSCTNDQECAALFGDPSYICHQPSANTADWGCLRPPDSTTCPDELPAFLTSDNIDLFPCIAPLGVNQEKCFKFEQQLRSGFMALDPNGINADQASNFLRPEAYLVVVFVSDEEDCSIADNDTIGENDYETCGLLKTTDEGGPLVPVAHYVNKFKALKSDPSKVIVAAISGDSLQSDPGPVAAERESYLASKGDPETCYHQTYICSSASGTADLGARLLEFTKGFGLNGTFVNICSDSGIGMAMQQIADLILSVVK